MIKRDIVKKLFLNNLKYVTSHSEFIGDTFSNALNNLFNTNNLRYVKKINKYIDKINKMDVCLDEVKMNNLLFLNSEIKKMDSKLSKKIMKDIQNVSSFGEIFAYLLNMYVDTISKPKEKNKIELPKRKLPDKKIVISKDSKGKYYKHIKFDGEFMLFDKDSFQLEVALYNKAVINKGEILKDSYDFSLYEKKRRIYISNMFRMDSELFDLYYKDLNITYPIDKIYKFIRSLVDLMYKEVVTKSKNTGALLKLDKATVESYGSSSKLDVYAKLYNRLNVCYDKADSFLREEFKRCSDSSKLDEYKNIKGLIPNKKEIYKILSNKIIIYFVLNYRDFNIIKKGFEYFDLQDIKRLYFEAKSNMISNNASVKFIIKFQKCVIMNIRDKYNMSEDLIFKDIITDDKLW